MTASEQTVLTDRVIQGSMRTVAFLFLNRVCGVDRFRRDVRFTFAGVRGTVAMCPMRCAIVIGVDPGRGRSLVALCRVEW